MRFLLGLMIGAVVVLAVAEGMQGGDDWRNRLEAAASAAAEYVQARRKSVDAAPGNEPRRTSTPAAPEGEISPEPKLLASAEAAASADVEAALQPIPRPPDPRAVDQSGSEVEIAEPIPADTAGALPALENPAVPLPGREDPRLPANEPEDPAATSSFRLQAVWVPFHSRVSANGFAERLMESLDHPFAVERRGPGRYQVVFPYADEPEREALLALAAEATGLPL